MEWQISTTEDPKQ